MKKWIITAALICCINGFAAAQKNTSKAIPKAEQKTTKKGKEAKTGIPKKTADKKTVPETYLVAIPKPDSDTANVPIIKNR